MADDTFARARDFIRLQARVLEQRLFATLFEGAPAVGVLRALAAYRNDDGGFGHGLEPDKLCPDSVVLDVETALDVMVAVGAHDPEVVGQACDWLASRSRNGAVALADPVIERDPHAEHWAAWAYEPGMNPTGGLVADLLELGVEHPWVDAATDWCWRSLEEDGLPREAHALKEALRFLAAVPDRARAEAIAAAVPTHLPSVEWYRGDADDPGYGVTPLDYAPTPTHPWRRLFDHAQVSAHLDALLAEQAEDGGWSLRWEPPSAAATLAYRGVVTVQALRVLVANGRVAVER